MAEELILRIGVDIAKPSDLIVRVFLLKAICARSSDWQSNCLICNWAQVQILPGTQTLSRASSYRTPGNHDGGMGYNYLEAQVKIWKHGISINEGGRGFIFVWTNLIFYVAFWTKWVCPRFWIAARKIRVDWKP